MNGPPDANDMAKLIAAMNRGMADPDAPVALPEIPIESLQKGVDPSERALIAALGAKRGDPVSMKPTPKNFEDEGDSFNAMKNILQRLQEASSNVVEASEYDRELREALVTEEVTNGARIGHWEIHGRKADGRKFFDVVASGDPGLVLAEFTLYEAATGLVAMLNEGQTITSMAAMALLRQATEYSAAVDDMITFKHRIASAPRGDRRIIYEDRYDQAKQRALTAKARIVKGRL